MRYAIKAGETLSLDLGVVDGSTNDKSIVSTVTAVLKKAQGSGNVPDHTAPAAATFAVSDSDKGWVFHLASSVTQNLPLGIYVTDAKLYLTNGEVVITDPIQVEVRGSVT